MGIFRRKKKTNRFLELLEQQADYAVECLELLRGYVKTPKDDLAREITKVEKEADEVRRILIDELNNTFITPFDREDIFTLSMTIDDVTDYAKTTVDSFELFKVEPNKYIQRMVALLADATIELQRATHRLEDHPNVANEHAVRAKALENRVEKVYREALANLFQEPEDLSKVAEILKYREIYRHLSNAADRGDEAANVIGDIIIKWM